MRSKEKDRDRERVRECMCADGSPLEPAAFGGGLHPGASNNPNPRPPNDSPSTHSLITSPLLTHSLIPSLNPSPTHSPAAHKIHKHTQTHAHRATTHTRNPLINTNKFKTNDKVDYSKLRLTEISYHPVDGHITSKRSS